MFGAGITAQAVYNALRVRPIITAAVGTNIFNLSVAPQGTPFPCLLHYAESGTYTGPFSGMEPSEETVSYIVRLICVGTSDQPIRAAAKDALSVLVGELALDTVTVTQDSETFNLSMLIANEWPLTTIVDEDVIYRQLGFYVTAYVNRA